LHVRSEWTIQLVPEPRKMATITAQRRRGTWEGVPVATWCCEWICRIGRGLVHHIFIISPAFYLSSVAWCGSRSCTDNTFRWRVLCWILQFFQFSSFSNHSVLFETRV